MIIWLAISKSGNTWVRLFLNSLFFSSDGKLDINNVKIGQFPERRYFDNLIDNLDDIKKYHKIGLCAKHNQFGQKNKIFKTPCLL